LDGIHFLKRLERCYSPLWRSAARKSILVGRRIVDYKRND
jgi:hypothetical protein